MNAAGWVRVDDAEDEAVACFAANADGAIRLSAAAAERGISSVNFSSDLVFGGCAAAYLESDAVAPRNVYGASKAAMERLLLDLIEGDQTLFVRRDEVEAQWTWTDALRAGWAANGTRPKSYPAGTWGPSAAIALTERDGVTWQDD